MSVIEYPQSDAALLLGVSISTLKRRFYDLGMGRWPYPQIKLYDDTRSMLEEQYKSTQGSSETSSTGDESTDESIRTTSKELEAVTTVDKMSMSAICNEKNSPVNQEAKRQLIETMTALNNKW